MTNFTSVTPAVGIPFISKGAGINTLPVASFNLTLQSSMLASISEVNPNFSRSTTGTVVDFEGAIHTAKINETRFTGARRVENLINNSVNFKASYGFYSNTRCTIDSETIEAPDGTNTATHCIQKVGESGAGIANNFNIASNPISGNIRMSCYLKKSGLNWGALYTSPGAKTWFDLDNGVVGTVDSEHSDATITDVGNGWYRCSITIATETVDRCGAYLAESDGNTTINPQGVGIYIWGYQLEQLTGSQTEASEYISTGVSVQTGEELITNGDFSSPLGAEWALTLSTGGGTIVRVDEQLKFTQGSVSKGMFASQSITTTIGQSYCFEVDLIAMSSSNYVRIQAGTTQNGDNLLSVPYTTGPKSFKVFFTATTTTSWITLVDAQNVAQTTTWDNVSVKEEYFHGANVDGVKYFQTDRSDIKISESVLKGYLNEPSSTNLLTYSEEFDKSIWATPKLSVVANQIIAPNGTLTADKCIENTDTALHSIYQIFASVDSNTYTWSGFVKKGERTKCVIVPQATTTIGTIKFDLVLGSIISTTGSVTGTITEIYDDWYFLTATAIATGTGNGYWQLNLLDDAGESGYQGDGSSGLYLWGTQVEQSPFPTSYIKTEASTVTKTADALTINNTGRDVLPNSFCLIGTWSPLGDADGYENANMRLFGSRDSRGTSYEQRCFGGAGYDYGFPIGGGYFYIIIADITQSIGNKYAFQLFQDGSNVNAKIYKDGVSKYSDIKVQTLDHSNTTLEIGSWNSAVFASNIKKIKIFNKELTDSQLTSVTR